jgi:hypothetical protein
VSDSRTSIIPLGPALGALFSDLPPIASTGWDLLGFTVDAQADGIVTQHRSHASHASHTSHASHHSHFSSR